MKNSTFGPAKKTFYTPGWEMFVGFRENYDAWRAFFETYSDRIFYGTDTAGYPIKKAIHETVRYAVGLTFPKRRRRTSATATITV